MVSVGIDFDSDDDHPKAPSRNALEANTCPLGSLVKHRQTEHEAAHKVSACINSDDDLPGALSRNGLEAGIRPKHRWTEHEVAHKTVLAHIDSDDDLPRALSRNGLEADICPSGSLAKHRQTEPKAAHKVSACVN